MYTLFITVLMLTTVMSTLAYLAMVEHEKTIAQLWKTDRLDTGRPKTSLTKTIEMFPFDYALWFMSIGKIILVIGVANALLCYIAPFMAIFTLFTLIAVFVMNTKYYQDLPVVEK